MRVRHLSVRNFTSLLDIDLTDLPNLVVFIGQNSSGKSNLIDALALLFGTFGTQLSLDLGSVDQYHHLFPNHSTLVDQPPEIMCTLTLTSEEWIQLFDVDDEEGRILEQEELHVAKRLSHHNGLVQWDTHTLDIGQWEIVINGDFEYDAQPIILEGSLEHGSPTEIEIEVIVEELLTGLGALFASAFEVVYTTESTRNWENRFVERPTIVDTAHIANLWQQSQSMGNQRQLWTRVAQQFEQIAPNEQRPVGVASSIYMEEGTLSIPIGMTGEGSQATLRLIDRLARGPGVMAIEEPETHLHPAMIKQVGQLLAELAAEGRQLFISTHSPSVCLRCNSLPPSSGWQWDVYSWVLLQSRLHLRCCGFTSFQDSVALRLICTGVQSHLISTFLGRKRHRAGWQAVADLVIFAFDGLPERLIYVLPIGLSGLIECLRITHPLSVALQVAQQLSSSSPLPLGSCPAPSSRS